MSAEHGSAENARPETGMRTYVQMPEGSVLTGVVEVVSYLDPEGNTCYGFRWPDEMNYSNVLGLLDLTKAQIVRNYFDATSED